MRYLQRIGDDLRARGARVREALYRPQGTPYGLTPVNFKMAENPPFLMGVYQERWGFSVQLC